MSPGRYRGEVPKLEGTTIGFAHVPGPASYASISEMDKKILHRGVCT